MAKTRALSRSPLLLPVAGCALALTAPWAAAAEGPSLRTFTTQCLSDQFLSEGAAFGDFNHDGAMDVVSGPYWYEGPAFTVRHEYYPAKPFDPHGYSDNFFAWACDLNGDGDQDIVVVGFPGKDASWFENPGPGKDGPWARHQVFDTVDNESPAFIDVVGDARPELLCITGGHVGYASVDWAAPAKPWIFHPVSAKGGWGRFTHGLGVGDLNGDGRKDILMREGWWEQPSDLTGDPQWLFHPADFGGGGAQMEVYDVNGDGRADVVTSLAAHDYGLAWFEQNADHSFTRHLIMGDKPEDNRYGVHFSELHALQLVDMDGDGLKDIVTGRRWWSHGPHGAKDAEFTGLLYWFKLVRGAGGAIDWVPHLIHDASGVGTQVMVGDLNGDGLPDIVVGNKKGTFVHLQHAQPVDQAAYDAAQPKPLAH